MQNETNADADAATSEEGMIDGPDTGQTDHAAADEKDDVQAETHEGLTLLLEDARSKADEHWDLLVRSRAELDNLKKRHSRDLENAHKFALERFVEALVGVWDSLDMGHQASQAGDADLSKVIEGTELTLKQMQDVMHKFGVEQLDPYGEAFNPEFHQAMTMTANNDVPANTVIHVMQKGYTLNGRLVRPALVTVSQAGS